MKKLLVWLQVVTVLTPAVGYVVACNIGTTSTRPYLTSLEDYDWTTDTGDNGDYNFKDTNLSTGAVTPTDEVDINQVVNGPVDTVFDYDKFSTGYKTKLAIKKQGVTGAPIIKTYRPNGNIWSDFGVESKSRMYENFNSVLEWDKNDLDLKYNIATQDINNRNYVANKSLDRQLQGIYYNRYHDKSNSNSSIVGTNNPYSGMMTNYSYINNFYGWSGFTNLGWLTPMSADVTEQLHKNGVPAIGLLYLSGWEDVSREKLRKLFEKDERGNFKIVDILINQALRLNFDGWYINDEANGSGPDGSVVKQNDIYQIIRQFNIRAEKIEKETGKNLTFTYYRNISSVNKADPGYTMLLNSVNGTSTGFGSSEKNRTHFQLNFNKSFPGQEKEFFVDKAALGETFKSQLATMYYEGANTAGLGNIDIRKYLYEITNQLGDGHNNLEYNYENPAGLSFGTFGSGASNDYARSAYNAFSRDAKTSADKFWARLKSQEVATMYNGYQYTGLNGYLKSDAQGYERYFSDYSQMNQDDFNNMLNKVKRDVRYSTSSSLNDILSQDPRIKAAALKGSEISEAEKAKNPQLYWDASKGAYPYSYGYGNEFAEQTVFTDTKLNQLTYTEEPGTRPNLATNFSTGSGMYFVDRDSTDKLASVVSEYPWTNNRLADIMPTYQWDFWKTTPSEQTIADETVDGTKNRLKITSAGQLGGYFDYNNPYKKGNSLAIGNGYDFDSKTGEVRLGAWEANSAYNWNLIGTNIQDNDYTVEFVVKASKADAITASSNDSIAQATKILLKTTADSAPKALTPSQITPIDNGWYRVQLDLSKVGTISSQNRLAKVGLQINTATDTDFIFNVGEFSFKDNKVKTPETEVKINSLTNEATIVRDQKTSLRFNWAVENASAVDYYEIFYKYDNKWYRAGETTQTAYYLKDLITNNQITLGIRAKYKDNRSSKVFVGTFNT